MANALRGIQICDLSRVLVGPYCSMVLADMGAEVIKIERPGIGDETRSYGPPFINGVSCYFLSVNRNKKSVVVDITKKEAKEILLEIAEKSDVFIENFMPGKLASLSLGYEDIAAVNPKIIYCSLTGFGTKGPLTSNPGYDVIASAIGGSFSVTGEKDGRPTRPGIAIVDILTGLYAHSSIIAALYEKERTGKGKKIDCSLLQSQIASLSHLGASYLNAGVVTSRMGTEHPNIVPYQAFDAKDGMFVIAVGNDKQFKKMCTALDLHDLAEDKRFADNPSRVENRSILCSMIQERIQTQSKSYWIKELEKHRVPCGNINDIGEALETPTAKQYIQELNHPHYGDIRVSAPAVDFEEDAPANRKSVAPPLLGEHTEEIMKQLLNYDDHRIKELMKHKIIE